MISPPPGTHSSPGEGPLDLVEGLHGAPALGNEAALGHVQVEHVEGMVDGLYLLHLQDNGNMHVQCKNHEQHCY